MRAGDKGTMLGIVLRKSKMEVKVALEKALEDQKRFLGDFAKAFPDLAAPFMSVNVSGLQLADMDEIDLLAGIIN